MWNEQFTWLTPHSQQEKLGLPWRNRRNEETKQRSQRRQETYLYFAPSCLRVFVAKIFSAQLTQDHPEFIQHHGGGAPHYLVGDLEVRCDHPVFPGGEDLFFFDGVFSGQVG